MAINSLQDSRLDSFVRFHTASSRRLETLFDALMLAQPGEQFQLLERVLAELSSLGSKTARWATKFVPEFISGPASASEFVLSNLGTGVVFEPVRIGQLEEIMITELVDKLGAARQSIQNLATRIFRSNDLSTEFPLLGARALQAGATEETLQSVMQQLLRDKTRGKIVSVIGEGGRVFEFELDFYAGMVSSNVATRAAAGAVIVKANQAGHDLVRVSPNKSKTGDWCDAYRGRVFSISGTHPVFPSLALTPNGGPPFHPFCRHDISIFDDSRFTAEQLATLGEVSEAFLLSPVEENANRIARNWWALKKSTPDPAPLKL